MSDLVDSGLRSVIVEAMILFQVAALRLRDWLAAGPMDVDPEELSDTGPLSGRFLGNTSVPSTTTFAKDGDPVIAVGRKHLCRGDLR